MAVFLGELDAGQLVPILRYLFLSAITNQAPGVLEELGNEIMPLFVKVSSTTSEQKQQPPNETALKWRDKIIKAGAC
jgi:hypothetical protein